MGVRFPPRLPRARPRQGVPVGSNPAPSTERERKKKLSGNERQRREREHGGREAAAKQQDGAIVQREDTASAPLKSGFKSPPLHEERGSSANGKMRPLQGRDVGSIPTCSTRCDRRPTVKTSGFHPEDEGSIPSDRSRPTRPLSIGKMPACQAGEEGSIPSGRTRRSAPKPARSTHDGAVVQREDTVLARPG